MLISDLWRSRRSPKKDPRYQAAPGFDCASMTREGKISSLVSSRKLIAALVLTGLLATASMADTGLCGMVCASRIGIGGSSEPAIPHHLHRSAAVSRNPSLHTHANSRANNLPSIVNGGEVVLEAPRCARYQLLATFLDASRVTVTEESSGSSNPTVLAPLLVEENDQAAPSPQSSPPDSPIPPRSAPTSLRI